MSTIFRGGCHMDYYVEGNKVSLPTDQEPFCKGSEGKIYKKGNYAYKIYYKEMLNENYGNKEKFHQYFLTIPTKQIILPDKLIYTEDGEYIGYRTKMISGSKNKKTGIIRLPKSSFINNLKVLENDFNLLSNNYVLSADVSPVNYIFNKKDDTMNVIDPGRYRHHCLEKIDDYKRQNDKQLIHLIDLLLYLDLLEYKPIKTKRKIQELKDYIIQKRKKKDLSYSEFFEEELANYENAEEYAKSLTKYIK